jgi:hypothetical protein
MLQHLELVLRDLDLVWHNYVSNLLKGPIDHTELKSLSASSRELDVVDQSTVTLARREAYLDLAADLMLGPIHIDIVKRSDYLEVVKGLQCHY